MARCFCLRTFSLANIFPLTKPNFISIEERGLYDFPFLPEAGMDREEGQSNFAFLIFIFIFLTVDWTRGGLSFGLRWQKKRQEFSSVNIQVGYGRCRFHPTGGFSHQRI